jgi:transposase
LRPILEEGISQIQVAQTHRLPLRTLQRWLKQYRQHGLAGLVRQNRADRGQRRGMPPELIQLIEGLALQKPAPSVANIHHRVKEVATEQGWNPPCYSRVYQIVQKLDPALYKAKKTTLAVDSNGVKTISEAEHGRICAAYEQKLEQLYAEIGKLTTEINWLKKKFPGLSEKRD